MMPLSLFLPSQIADIKPFDAMETSWGEHPIRGKVPPQSVVLEILCQFFANFSVLTSCNELRRVLVIWWQNFE
jgi:hypothetical protein